MANMAEVVKYEGIHELRLTYPNSDKFLGLTVGLRNPSSEFVKAKIRKLENDRIKAGRGKQKKYTAENMEQAELETTAACIAWSKWENDADGDPCTYNGETPDLSKDSEMACEMLDKLAFFYAQVKVASSDIENFM